MHHATCSTLRVLYATYVARPAVGNGHTPTRDAVCASPKTSEQQSGIVCMPINNTVCNAIYDTAGDAVGKTVYTRALRTAI